MKILAIRGKNLASISTSFEISLDQGLLGHSGLFAITGDTGAGKSTILDAMTLAIYGKAVRFDGIGKADTRNEQDRENKDSIHIGDVRNILSRGQTSGSAGVDLLADDGKKYRFTWSVKRARNKPDGTLQQVERGIMVWDGSTWQPVASSIKDVSNRISSIVNLSWEQFRRMVLLPQGDFGAFLEAKPTERARLLETITGTAIYSGVAEAVKEHRKQWTQRIAEKQALIDNFGSVNEEELAALDQQIAQKTAVMQEGEKLLEQIGQFNRLHGQYTAERQNLQQAQETVGRISSWLEENRTLQESVERYDRLKSGELPLNSFISADSALQRSLADESRTAADIAVQQEKHSALECRRAECCSALESFRGEKQKIEAQIREAEKIQIKAEENCRALSLAEAEQSKRTAERNETAVQHIECSRELEKCRSELESAQQYCEKHSEFKDCWQNGQLLAQRMTELLEQYGRRGEVEAQIGAAQQQLKLQESELASVRARKTEFESRLQQLAQQKNELEKALAACSETELRAAMEKKNTVAADFRVLTAHGATIRRELESLAAGREKLCREQLREQQLSADTAELEKQCTAGQAKIEGQEDLVRDLEVSIGLAAYRDLVKEGEPCPLCGSTVHNPGVCSSASDDLMKQADEFLNQYKKEQKKLEKKFEKLKTELAALQASNKSAADANASLSAGLNRLQQEWNETSSDYAELAWREDPGSEAAVPEFIRISDELEKLQQRNSQYLAELEQKLAEVEKINKELKKNSEMIQRTAEELKEVENGISSAESAKNTVMQQLSSLEAQLDAARHNIEAAVKALTETGGAGLSAMVSSDPAEQENSRSRIAAWRSGCDSYGECLQRARELDNRVQVLTGECEALAGRLAACEHSLKESTERVELHRKTGDEYTAQISQILNGDTVEEAGRKIAERQQQLDNDLEACDSEIKEAAAALAALEGSLERIRTQSAEQRTTLENAQHKLQEFLDEHGLSDRSELEEIIRTDPKTVENSRIQYQNKKDELNAAAGAVENVTGRVEELARQNNELLSQFEPAAVQDDHLDSSWCDLQKQQQEELGRSLEQDKISRGQKTDLLARIATARREIKKLEDESYWISRLDELCRGSNLVNYVQDLVFTRLVEFANLHLARMIPRYTLKTDDKRRLSLILVDHNQASSERPVNTASGGEKFIVSLALAVSLADLSGTGVSVDTLFIDEGFGTLDRQNLDKVIKALESFHSRGKQIGIITHVDSIIDQMDAKIEVKRRNGSGFSEVFVPV